MSNPYQNQSGTPAYEPNYGGGDLPTRHSGLGIASFIISLAVALLELIGVVLATVFTMRAGGAMNSQSPEAIATGFLICGGLLLALVGAALGIAGVMMRGRKKLFAILGLAFNGVVLLAVAGLMVLGLMAKR